MRIKKALNCNKGWLPLASESPCCVKQGKPKGPKPDKDFGCAANGCYKKAQKERMMAREKTDEAGCCVTGGLINDDCRRVKKTAKGFTCRASEKKLNSEAGCCTDGVSNDPTPRHLLPGPRPSATDLLPRYHRVSPATELARCDRLMTG